MSEPTVSKLKQRIKDLEELRDRIEEALGDLFGDNIAVESIESLLERHEEWLSEQGGDEEE